MSYSQNAEDTYIANYFGDFKGNLLEIGANEGITLSNSKLLIEQGWSAYLIEPGSVCGDLILLHKGNPKVHIYNYGIGIKEEIVTFYESGAHVFNGTDRGLVSTFDFAETIRWRNNGVDFTEQHIQLVPFDKFYNYIDNPVFDFISIDAEGYDWQILQQIDLALVGVKALCIEWNGNPELKILFTKYCEIYGLKLAHINSENLIFIL